MSTAAVRGWTSLAIAGALLSLMAASIAGTSAYFTSQVQGTIALTTGEVAIVPTGLDQTYTALMPGIPQERDFSFENASTGVIDVYLWLEPAGGADGLDYCATEVAPFLQLRITEAADTIVDWTSVCNVVNAVDRSGALAPILLATDVPIDAVRDYTMSLRLHPDSDTGLQTLSSTGDALVLFAIQDGAPALPPASSPPSAPIPAPGS